MPLLSLFRPKKRIERGGETPQERIVRELRQERIEELRKIIKENNSKLVQISREQKQLNNNPSAEFIEELLKRKKAEEAQALEEKVKYEEWLKEREQKHAAAKESMRRSRLGPGRSGPVQTQVIPDVSTETRETDTSVKEESSMSIDTDTSVDASASAAPASTSPLLTSLLQNAGAQSYSRDSSSPQKSAQFFPNSTPTSSSTTSARQASPENTSSTIPPSSKPSADKQLPSSAPTLSKLLEQPLTNPSNKLPSLPAALASSGKDVDSLDKSAPTIKEEPVDSSETANTEAEKKESASAAGEKTQSVRKSRNRTSITTSASAQSTPSGPSTRRSGRIKGIRESESESSTLDKKPSISDDHTDASASEESLDALVKAQASSSKAPSTSDSGPASPASSTMHSEDPESLRNYRKWKANILQHLKICSTHRYAHWFAQPVDDETAAGYQEIVKKPMDLQTIKARIETPGEHGIRTTAQFKRDMMLMFQNALFYNHSTRPDLCKEAIEMQREFLLTMEDDPSSFERSISATPAPSSSTTPANTSATAGTTASNTIAATNAPGPTPSTTSKTETTPAHPKPSRATRTIKTEDGKKQPGSATIATATDSTTTSGRRRSRASTEEPLTSASTTPVTRTMKKKNNN